ncbi:hypothetical protein ACFFX1_30950 [Dactylosporangium sucinum]|uniref:Uncharacterized protein n=1 Tax=Dactylosporangium sucinum TaxID=1424081 RepID=A0A917TV34_9ACTN|nr:hypothetical protein [Dactylosporangium sucinum]GGM39246.1 hypothetical protein GCM10007977_045880 [Dactylosporangium sucinum]
MTRSVAARQLSLFGVEARPPAPHDLEGLLLGAGQVGRMGGTGRVTTVVEDAWRCAVLRAECELRGLVLTCEPAVEEDRFVVRTAYSAALAPLAARWLDDDGVQRAPGDLALDGRRLRLWVAAAGGYDGQRAYLLRLAPKPRPPEPEAEVEAEVGAEAEAEVVDEAAAVAGEPEVVHEPEEPPINGHNGHTPPVDRREIMQARADAKPNKRRKKPDSKVSAFDPGPDEFADFDAYDGPDPYAEVEPFSDPGADEWPDSGIADLPTVALDTPPPPPEPAPKPAAESPQSGEITIDRTLADNWIAVGEALVAIGLPAVFIAPDEGGPAYRIVGLRRINRLAEFVGESPAEAPPEVWPR